MTATTHDALTSTLQTLVSAQLALRWTPPALAKSLQASVASVAALGATMKLSVATGNQTAPSSGQKADALSLGVGVSASAASSISAGLSLGIGLSATASLLAQLDTGLNVAISKTADLQRALVDFNAQAALQAGTNGVMPPGRKVEQQPVNSALRGLSDQVGACQAKANAAAAGLPVNPISAELDHQRIGAWECALDLDVETPPTGKIKFQLDDLEFTGTVLPDHTGTDGARGKCRVVGGNGHLSHTIDAHSYSGGAGIKVGTVVRDILKACGEDLSDLSDGPTLDISLPRWHVQQGSGQQALTALAEKVNAAWRVMRDGTVWFGVETWPEVNPDGVLTGETWSNGHLTLASETPNMVPGTVFQGQKIEHVTHSYGATLRTHLRTEGGDPVQALKAITRQRGQIDFSREYPCKVVTQNPDGTLQLLPDDDVMRSRGINHVPIHTGLPGFKVKVKNGARCTLTFAAGDPTRPRVFSWEFDADAVESVEMVAGGRSAPLARLGDPVKVFVAPGVPIPITGAIGIPPAAVPIAPGTFIAITSPLVGVIDGGNPLFTG